MAQGSSEGRKRASVRTRLVPGLPRHGTHERDLTSGTRSRLNQKSHPCNDEEWQMSMIYTNTPSRAVESGRRYYLGIDSGGTNTRALLADDSGKVWGSGYAGSANPNHYPRSQIIDNLQRAIGASMEWLLKPVTLTSVFMGASGISTDCDCADMRSLLRGLPEIGSRPVVEVESDTLIGLTGGLTGRPGLVLIAGTGSACYGMNAQGHRYLCGGWGALADDVGSAPWIGVRAIQAAVLAQDGRMPATRLRDIVFDYLELSEPRQLIHRVHNQGLDRAAIGRLAPLVMEIYGEGDYAAGEIVRDAVIGLSNLVKATRDRLFDLGDCEMILVGGVALSGPPFQQLLLEQIRAFVPGVRPREPELSPVQGAILEAMRASGATWNAQTIANLKAGALESIPIEIEL